MGVDMDMSSTWLDRGFWVETVNAKLTEGHLCSIVRVMPKQVRQILRGIS